MEPINLPKTADELGAQDVFIHNLTAERDRLRAAAQAVVDRWVTPLWKDAPHTGNYISDLREALKGQQ